MANERRLDAIWQSPVFAFQGKARALTAAQRESILELSQHVQQGVYRDHLWAPGTAIRVAFLSGDPAICQRIKQSALQWQQYANIQLEFTTDATVAEIRIGVDLNGKSESVIGLDANGVPGGQETMHFRVADKIASSQADYDSVVLHEFLATPLGRFMSTSCQVLRSLEQARCLPILPNAVGLDQGRR